MWRRIPLFCVLLASTIGSVAAEEPPPALWRIVDAIATPWSPTPVSPAAAALRGSGIAIAAGAIKAPAALACTKAKVMEQVMPWPTIFGGTIPAARRAEIVAELDLEPLANGAFVRRADCGKRVFDYYVGQRRMLLLFDGALLILRQADEERVDDVDDWVKPLNPGFDCTQSRTVPERLACVDYRLSVQSRSLNQRYDHLRATVSAASFATIRDAQRGWAPWLAARCKVPADMPAEWIDRRDLAECLRTETEARTMLFGVQAIVAGPFRLEPRMHAIYRAVPPIDDTVVYPWLSGPAGSADSFNHAIEAKTQPAAPFLTADLIAFPEADVPLYARRHYIVSAATERLISLTIVADWDGGGAHGGLRAEAINFDPERGRVVSLNDFFRRGSGWEAAIEKLCFDSLDHSDNPIFDPGVRTVIGDPGAWTFDRKAAHVFFDVYSTGSFSGGASEVSFRYAQLRRYLRPDAPLP